MRLTRHQRRVLARMAQGWQIHQSGGMYSAFSVYLGKECEPVRWDTWHALIERKFIVAVSGPVAQGTNYEITDAGRAAVKGKRS